jgi:hypothetical protein
MRFRGESVLAFLVLSILGRAVYGVQSAQRSTVAAVDLDGDGDLDVLLTHGDTLDDAS